MRDVCRTSIGRTGLIGYFPTYTLGNVYCAQLFAAAERAIGPLEDAFARGEFEPLREWLREHVHRHGMRWPVPELIERATGAAGIRRSWWRA